MDKYLLALSSLMILFFIGSWAFLHILITAHKSGTIIMRGTAYYKNDSRPFHRTDFMGMMVINSFIFVFITLLFLALLFLLASTNAGLVVLSLLSILNICITLRKAPSKKTKPNISFSIISILGAITTIICILVFAQEAQKSYIILVAGVSLAICQIFIHIIRIKTDKFLSRFKKSKRKYDHFNTNA